MKITKLSLSACLFITACAATQTMDTREPHSRANVQLDFSKSADVQATFPQAIDPRLPSVDRMSRHLGDQVASVELCVAPAGHVTKVAIVDSSGDDRFDAALLRDAKEWQFASLPGHSASGTVTLQTCERATVKYIAPR